MTLAERANCQTQEMSFCESAASYFCERWIAAKSQDSALDINIQVGNVIYAVVDSCRCGLRITQGLGSWSLSTRYTLALPILSRLAISVAPNPSALSLATSTPSMPAGRPL
jgi:hypothetical protein